MQRINTASLQFCGMNRWSYMFVGIVFFLGVVALRNYFILQTSGTTGSTQITPSLGPSGSSTSGSGTILGGNLPSSQNFSLSSGSPQIPQTLAATQGSVSNGQIQSGADVDPSTSQHTMRSGGRSDILQVGQIQVSQSEAYTGDDITFTIIIQNQAPYKKFVRQLCFQSSEGNFGCSPGFNLDPGQVFSISNNGRFASSGTKSVWITWTQDSTNFYSPVNSHPVTIQIL